MENKINIYIEWNEKEERKKEKGRQPWKCSHSDYLETIFLMHFKGSQRKPTGTKKNDEKMMKK